MRLSMVKNVKRGLEKAYNDKGSEHSEMLLFPLAHPHSDPRAAACNRLSDLLKMWRQRLLCLTPRGIHSRGMPPILQRHRGSKNIFVNTLSLRQCCLNRSYHTGDRVMSSAVCLFSFYRTRPTTLYGLRRKSFRQHLFSVVY